MQSKVAETYPKVVVDNGKHLLIQPNGDYIHGLVWTRVYDGLHGEQPYVIAKINITLKDTQ